MAKRHRGQNNQRTSKRFRNTKPLLSDIWVNTIVPLVDSGETAALNRFHASCRFFNDASNSYYRQLLIQFFKDENELKVDDGIRRLIEQIKHPRSVYFCFKDLDSNRHSHDPYNLLHLVCYDLSNPILWYLFDDDVDRFFTHIQREHAIDYVSTAFIFQRTNLLGHLLPLCLYSCTKERVQYFLHAAIHSGSIKMIDMIISYAEACRFTLELDETAFFNALHINKLPIINVLLQQILVIAKPILTWNHLSNIVLHAIKLSSVDIVEALIIHFAKFGFTDCGLDFQTLEYAITSGNIPMLDHIVQRLSPSIFEDIEPAQAMVCAIESGNPAMLARIKQALVEYHSIPDPQILITTEDLRSAACSGKQAMVDHILDQLPKPLELNHAIFISMLSAAILSGNMTVVKYIVTIAEQHKIIISPTNEILDDAASQSLDCYQFIIQLAEKAKTPIAPAYRTIMFAISSHSLVLVETILHTIESNTGMPFIPNHDLLEAATKKGNIAIFNFMLKLRLTKNLYINLERLLHFTKFSYNPLMAPHINNMIQDGFDEVLTNHLPPVRLPEPFPMNHCYFL